MYLIILKACLQWETLNTFVVMRMFFFLFFFQYVPKAEQALSVLAPKAPSHKAILQHLPKLLSFVYQKGKKKLIASTAKVRRVQQFNTCCLLQGDGR